MISNYEQGGLKMIDVISFAKALKSNWIKKYLVQNNLAKWKLFFDSHLHDFGGATIFKFNLNQKDLLTVRISDPFLLELLQIWSPSFVHSPSGLTPLYESEINQYTLNRGLLAEFKILAA